ncbi:hypothetical protein KJ068_19250 [bacterium]|nr:hypothetical protein [bacterium]RIK78350.1 MAG: hypothetical protein DCC62_07670 [candidate division KSB1 bacterium]
MQNEKAFGEVLEAADHLTLDEQESLVDILRRRLVERRRLELAADIQEAMREFKGGNAQASTPEELMREIVS